MMSFFKKIKNKKFWIDIFYKTEHIVDKLITPAVFILLIIIILELGFSDIVDHYEYIIGILNQFIILLFILDLIFKYNHVRNWKKFLKYFWLDIIAVFPFFLLFKAFESVSSVFQLGDTGQKLFHEGLELEKEGSKLVAVAKVSKVGSITSKTSKFSKFNKFIRPLSRLPKLIKIISRIRWHKKKHEISIFYNPKLFKELLKKKKLKKRKKRN